MQQKKRVLIISRNYNNLIGMARSLSSGDYDLEIIRLIQVNYKFMKVLAKSYPERSCRYISKYHICLTNWEAERFKSFLIDLYEPDRETLLILCDDLALPWVDESLDELRKYYRISSVDEMQGRLAEIMNKQVQKRLALEFGLPTANAHELCVRDGKYTLPEGISYPCFVKPAVLVMGSKDYLKRYDNPEDLAEAIALMANKFKNLDILIEDFIDIKNEYAILGMAADGKVLIPDGCLQFVQGGHGSRKGIMATGQIVSSPEILKFIEQLKGFLATLNYTGLFDVDALASDDRIYFCELNLRFGGSGYAITQGGVNFPRMFADYMLYGTQLPDECRLDGIGKTFVSEKILLEDFTEHFLTKEEVNKAISSADIHFLIDEYDPAPYRIVQRQSKFTAKLMMKLKETYKKLKH